MYLFIYLQVFEENLAINIDPEKLMYLFIYLYIYVRILSMLYRT